MLGLANFENEKIEVYSEFSNFETEYLKNLSPDTTYVINFWATWCGPCVTELPNFEKFAKEQRDKPYKIILVSLDFKNKVQQVIDLVTKKEIKSKVVMLSDGKSSEWIDKISQDWSGAIPATLVIKNKKRYFYEKSYETYDELKEEIINIE